MYRFNSYDQRLERMLEIAVIIMESLSGFEDKLSYCISGHSGDSLVFNLRLFINIHILFKCSTSTGGL